MQAQKVTVQFLLLAILQPQAHQAANSTTSLSGRPSTQSLVAWCKPANSPNRVTSRRRAIPLKNEAHHPRFIARYPQNIAFLLGLFRGLEEANA